MATCGLLFIAYQTLIKSGLSDEIAENLKNKNEILKNELALEQDKVANWRLRKTSYRAS